MVTRWPSGTGPLRVGKAAQLVLAGAVALCTPMIPEVLNGNVTPVDAGRRFLMALIVSWLAGSLLTSVTDRYTREAHRSQALKLVASTRRPIALGGGSPPSLGSPTSDVETDSP